MLQNAQADFMHEAKAMFEQWFVIVRNETEARSFGQSIRTVIAAADHRFDRAVAVPIGLVVALTFVLVSAVLWWTAYEQDRLATGYARQIVAGALANRKEIVQRYVTDYAVWNDAYHRLHEQTDMAWADENIGTWIFQMAGIDLSYVVSPSGVITYAMENGRRRAELPGQAASEGLRPLIEQARRLGPESAVGGMTLVDGRPALAAVGTIQPETGRPADTPLSLLIFVDLLNQPLLDQLARSFDLRGLHWLQQGEPPLDGTLPVSGVNGHEIGVLTWRVELPGSNMLRTLAPALAAVLMTVALLTGLILRHASAMAHLLHVAEARTAHDPLTGLPNRLLLIDRIERALATIRRERTRAAILYIDLDGFKQVNDTHGHYFGDLLLMAIAERLQGALREVDTVARLGGDEFVVVQVGGDQPAGAATLCRRLLERLIQPFELEGHKVMIGCSIGIALAPDDGDDPAKLLRHADLALYRAKQSGRQTFRFFHAELDQLRSTHGRLDQPAATP